MGTLPLGGGRTGIRVKAAAPRHGREMLKGGYRLRPYMGGAEGGFGARNASKFSICFPELCG